MHKKYEDISIAEAENMTEEIWKKIFPEKKDSGEDTSFREVSHISACYLLWEIKKNPSIKTADELYKAYSAHVNDYLAAIVENLLFDELDVPEVWKRFYLIADEYTIDDLKACVLKTDPNLSVREEVPESIIDLADRMLEISGDDRIMDANPILGSFALRSMSNTGMGEYVNIAREDYMTPITYANIYSVVCGYDNISYVMGTDRNIDKVFVDSFNVSGKREPVQSEYSARDLWEEFPDDEYIYLNQWDLSAWAIAMTNYRGRVVSVMTAGELTNKSNEIYRSFLCENGYVEGVIALPDKMFVSTWVNSFLVIFSHDNKKIRFIDATDIYHPIRVGGRRVNTLTEDMMDEIYNRYKNSSDAIVKAVNEISETGYNLNPIRYVEKEESSLETVELGELLTSIKRGMTLKASEMDKYISKDVAYKKCIIPSQISNGVVEDQYYYHAETRNQKNDCFYGNILLSKTGSPFKAAVFNVYDAYLVIGNIYILGVDRGKVTPEYIKCFLSSKKGQEEMRRLAVGSGTPILRISDVPKIRIPVYEEKKQKAMEARAKEIVEEMELLHTQLRSEEDELARMFDEE